LLFYAPTQQPEILGWVTVDLALHVILERYAFSIE